MSFPSCSCTLEVSLQTVLACSGCSPFVGSQLYSILRLLQHLAGLIVLSPVTPTLLTNFFASRGQKFQIHCEDFSVDESPEQCRDAHASVVIWQSWSSFVANSLICFLLVSIPLLVPLSTPHPLIPRRITRLKASRAEAPSSVEQQVTAEPSPLACNMLLRVGFSLRCWSEQAFCSSKV